jgi:hypothetical protein
MFRFTIRDMLWLLVVLAVALGWVRAESARRRTYSHAAMLLSEFQLAKSNRDRGVLSSWTPQRPREVKWDLADQPNP